VYGEDANKTNAIYKKIRMIKIKKNYTLRTVEGVPRDPLDMRCLYAPAAPVVFFVHLQPPPPTHHAAGRFFHCAKGRPARDRVAA
jgi:hypothetical protein